jgi:hypothetical protein
MNERLKELAEQAGFAFSHDYDYWVAWDDEIERFAELVRQDERALANPDLSIEANRIAYDVAIHYANKTKEKLG